ncbi:hypothetical protein MMC30_008352 [Trapelia coarctata]|nr:hypothetical protein [Trapelia coarctata]
MSSLPPPGYEARIVLPANQAITGILFGLAFIAYIIRAYIRARIFKQFTTEDALLLITIICLGAATTMIFLIMPDMYRAVRITTIVHEPPLDGSGTPELLKALQDVERNIYLQKMTTSVTTVWYFSLFSVKLAYLFFFRRLISKLRHLYKWWYFTVACTLAAGIVSIIAAWLTCPYFTPEGFISCTTPAAAFRAMRDTDIAAAVDIATDLLIISFPVTLLWQVRISLHQKIGLGCMLSLSVVMIVISITRMAGVTLYADSYDLVWLTFWQHQECSIAVIMVSATAFRGYFTAKASSHYLPERRPEDGPTISKRIFRRHRSREEDDLEDTMVSSNGSPRDFEMAGVKNDSITKEVPIAHAV